MLLKLIIPSAALAVLGHTAWRLEEHNVSSLEKSLQTPAVLNAKPKFRTVADHFSAPGTARPTLAIKSEDVERPETPSLFKTWKADHTIFHLNGNGVITAEAELQVRKDGTISFSATEWPYGKVTFNVSAKGQVSGQARESGFCNILNQAVLTDPIRVRKEDLEAVYEKFCPTGP